MAIDNKRAQALAAAFLGNARTVAVNGNKVKEPEGAGASAGNAGLLTNQSGANSGGGTSGGGGLAGGSLNHGGSQHYQSLMNQLDSYMQKPLNYNPYADPQYVAAQEMARAGAKTATNNTMQTMNSRGLLKSSLTNSQLGQIEQKAELAPMELIPGMMQNAQMQHQQQFQNLTGMADMAYRKMAYDDSKATQDQVITGKYLPPGAKDLINQIIQQKKDYGTAQKGGATKEMLDQISTSAGDLRNQLNALGIDASQFGSGVNLEQAYKNAGTAGQLTSESQQTILNVLERFTENYGALPKGAGDIVSGLPAFTDVADLYKTNEGNSTMKFTEFAAKLGMDKEAHALSQAATRQNMGIAAWAQQQRITEVEAQKQLNQSMTDLLHRGHDYAGNDGLLEFMTMQQGHYAKNNVHLPTLMAFAIKLMETNGEYGVDAMKKKAEEGESSTLETPFYKELITGSLKK